MFKLLPLLTVLSLGLLLGGLLVWLWFDLILQPVSSSEAESLRERLKDTDQKRDQLQALLKIRRAKYQELSVELSNAQRRCKTSTATAQESVSHCAGPESETSGFCTDSRAIL